MQRIIQRYSLHIQKLLAGGESPGKGYPFRAQLHPDVPDDKTGVYRIFRTGSDATKSLYVGQTSSRSLRSRLEQHRDRSSGAGSSLKQLLEDDGVCTDGVAFFRDQCRFQFVAVDEGVAISWGLESVEIARWFFEDFAVAALQPGYNHGRRQLR